MSERTFEDRYRENDIPWDRTSPDDNLIQAVHDFAISPSRVLDLGCGTGINAVWLARQGFQVTGLDLSPTAIDKARGRARAEDVQINFLSGDVLDANALQGPFDLIFDRGAFHCFDGGDERIRCAQRIAELLADGGGWLSLIGNADDVEREDGPPTLTAAEITEIVEPRFEVQSLTAGQFGGEQDDPPKAWIAWMKKRSV